MANVHALSRDALIEADEKFKAGDLDAAEEAYNKVHFEECTDADVTFRAYNNRGALRIKRGRMDDAVIDFEAALTLKPNEADVWYNLGAARRNAGQVQKAVEAFDRCLELSPELYVCICSRAEALSAIGRNDEALEAASRAIKLDAKCARGYVALGYAHLKRSEHEQAVNFFEHAIKRGDDTAATKQLASLAASLAADDRARLGHFDGAISLYASALDRAEPRSASGATMRYNYALTLMNAGKTDESISQLREVLNVDANHAEAHNALGLTLLQQGDAWGAIDHLDHARQLAPSDLERLYNFGVAKLKLKDFDSAAAIFKLVLDREPNHAMSKEALDGIKAVHSQTTVAAAAVNTRPAQSDLTARKSKAVVSAARKEKNGALTVVKASPDECVKPAPALKEPATSPPTLKEHATSSPVSRRSSSSSSKSSFSCERTTQPQDVGGGASTKEYPVYSYEKLQAPGPYVCTTSSRINRAPRSYPDDVYVHEREMHLSDEEFAKLLGITKDVFARQPKWKKDSKKRSLKLF